MDSAYWHKKMNYITACPKCDTQFLLNDALIQAHLGKVQCGHCEHVFNAKNRLTELTDDFSIDDKALANDSTTDSPSESRSDDLDGNIGVVVDQVSSQAATEDTESNITAEEKTSKDSKVDIESIFNNKPIKKPNKHPALIFFLTLLLFLTLILESVYVFRNEIANVLPQVKPLLERACIPLKCTIELSRNLALIAIGDADMHEDEAYKSVIKFSTSIKNNAPYPQAYPNIALTLTDRNDQAVIKKLILPTDYLASKDKIKNGLSSKETATIKLSFHVNDANVASYRILLLY